jgi:RIO kinase 1
MPRIDPDSYADDSFDPTKHHGRPSSAMRRKRRRSEWDTTAVDPDLPDGAVRSTYQESRGNQGPQPAPPWLVTSPAALDFDRGLIKTGKEADVTLIERIDPRSGDRCLLAAKRYRSSEHRLFHRDAGYLEGRRVRRSRENRAMAKRTSFGRQVIAGQWALAEFEALGRLWRAGVAVPYPVQFGGDELLMEFIGDADGSAAPRLAELRPDDVVIDRLWSQCCDALLALAAAGFTHGDLSAYNLLVHRERLVLIDLPQVVDIVGNPQGAQYLRRDCETVCRWFAAHGCEDADAATLASALAGEAGLPWGSGPF